jgi:hypothetical protein
MDSCNAPHRKLDHSHCGLPSDSEYKWPANKPSLFGVTSPGKRRRVVLEEKAVSIYPGSGHVDQLEARDVISFGSCRDHSMMVGASVSRVWEQSVPNSVPVFGLVGDCGPKRQSLTPVFKEQNGFVPLIT